MAKVASFLALALSIVALVLAFLAWSGQRGTADRAIAVREERLIDDLWPGMQKVYRDLGATPPDARPATIEEMLAPLLQEVTPR